MNRHLLDRLDTPRHPEVQERQVPSAGGPAAPEAAPAGNLLDLAVDLSNQVEVQVGGQTVNLDLGNSLQVLMLQALQQQLSALVDVLGRIGNTDDWLVTRVIVANAGAAQQGPDITIPAGFSLVVRLRPHATGTPTGYVSPTRSGTANTATRSEIPVNGEIALRVTNMQAVWVDADTDLTEFEFITERR